MRLLPSEASNQVQRTNNLIKRFVRGSLLLVPLFLMGCFSSSARQQQELAEADLRSQERHIQELKAELDRKEGVIHGLDVEVERLQQAKAGAKQPGEPQPPGIVKEIVIGRLTGGYRHDPKANFDDALLIMLEPRDTDGHTIKVPGSVHIDLFEINPQGLKTPLSSYDLSHRELRRQWDQPLLGGPAYRILLAWKALPSMEKLRIVLRFTMLDGKLFEAEKDVNIRLPAGIPRPGLPVGVPGGYSVTTPGIKPAPVNLNEAGSKPGQMGLPSPQLSSGPRGLAKSREPESTTNPSADRLTRQPIPVIQFPPRELGSPNDGNLSAGDKSIPGEVPPLPAPPEPPTFDKKKKLNAEAEFLPPPRTLPDSQRPLEPGNNKVTTPGRPVNGIPLSSVPPQSWREQHIPVIQSEQSDQQMIKLERPILRSRITPE